MAQPSHWSRVSQALTLGSEQLRKIGERLGEAGLTERAVRVCFDVQSVGHAPLRTAAMTPPDTPPLAAVLPWLFAAAKPLPIDAVRAALGDELYDEFRRVDLIREQSVFAWAEMCVLPVGEALTLCDLIGRSEAPMPDDSAFHLIGSLPVRRVSRWLDIGTGNAIAPLARRDLGEKVLGTDVNQHSLDCAALGASLSGAADLELRAANLFEHIDITDEAWDLISFNAPIPRPYDGLLERFWTTVGDHVADDGEVLVHSQQQIDGYLDALDLPGETIAVRYTPTNAKTAFGITRWRPHAADRRELRHVELTARSPHVTRSQLDE